MLRYKYYGKKDDIVNISNLTFSFECSLSFAE